ncbi:MAG: hypothetical protein HN601_01750 [Candidatus Marinimicrobia bacterium]|jgi:oxalate decarboxylase/phosphoglucose isomerase-like protein (cupin superfamily)|nr:hypothetical protein [Candidatus Neomarinimicrobiota bacterium]
MKIYKHDGKILSIVYRDEDWVEGLNFITPNEMFVQVGSWWYQKGKKLDSHVHNDFERITTRTQEMTYVKKGSMRVLLYDEGQNYLEDYILNEGDLAVFAFGGHGYEILEDNTQIIEAKNGPFIDVKTDKTKF